MKIFDTRSLALFRIWKLCNSLSLSISPLHPFPNVFSLPSNAHRSGISLSTPFSDTLYSFFFLGVDGLEKGFYYLRLFACLFVLDFPAKVPLLGFISRKRWCFHECPVESIGAFIIIVFIFLSYAGFVLNPIWVRRTTKCRCSLKLKEEFYWGRGWDDLWCSVGLF